MKAMHCLIVHGTYRQSAAVGAAAYARSRQSTACPRSAVDFPKQIRDNAGNRWTAPRNWRAERYPPQPAGILEEKGQLQYHPV